MIHSHYGNYSRDGNVSERAIEMIKKFNDISEARELMRKGKYLFIDMDNPVKGYEEYDFRKGMRCKVDGYPFQLMYENGRFSLEAGAICFKAHYSAREIQENKEMMRFACGDRFAVICLHNDGRFEGFEALIPDKVRQQSFEI